MSNERFLQPFIERLLLYVGLEQTLAYVSTCKRHRKERKWLIEQHAVVDHEAAEQFAGGISIKYRSATIERVEQLDTLLPTLTDLMFAKDFNQPLANVLLPPMLTHLTCGDWFNQPLDSVTLPLTLTHLTFGYWFNRPLDNVTLAPTLTHLTFGDDFFQSLDKVTLPP